jgi:hypothetical protein
VGTFVTGFVLVAAWPTRPVVRVLAVLLVLLGIGGEPRGCASNAARVGGHS